MSNKKYTAEDLKPLKPRDDVVCNVDISRKAFEKNLNAAVQHALEFARNLVINKLPDKIRYVVYFGSSYDKNPLEVGEQLFPDDYVEKRRAFIESARVVDLLWRDGKVPEWINVSVESEDGEFTNVKLECCGRYSNKVEHIYHAHEGRAPFHVLGPPMPPEHELNAEGNKYDLYWNKGAGSE